MHPSTMVGMVCDGFNGNIKVGLFMAMLFPITIIIVTSFFKKHVDMDLIIVNIRNCDIKKLSKNSDMKTLL